MMHHSTSFSRKRFVWMAYLLVAFFTYLQASWGAFMPFLRDELQLSYTTVGLHFSAFALGMIFAGLISYCINQTWGGRFAIWLGAVGMAVGVLLLITSQTVILTILSALLMGLLGSILNNTIQANLSELYDQHRATALTRMSLVGSASAGLVPLVVSGSTHLGFGWRPALSMAAIALLVLFLHCWQVKLPIPHAFLARNQEPQTLSPLFWCYWSMLFLGVSIGYCLVYWGADFLRTVVGLSSSDAISAMSIFLFAGVIGRAFGSHLSKIKSEEYLITRAISVTGMGFLVLWLAPTPWLNLIGLFITGVGAANFYPLLLSVAISTTQQQINRVTARLSIGAGSAILITPFLLGWIADQIELKRAFGLVMMLLIAMIVLLRYASHLKHENISRYR